MADVPVMPAHMLDRIASHMARLENATLAAAMITAAGRPHSVEEVRQLMNDLHWSSHPSPGNGAYQEWARTSAARMKVPHK
jgi:hypothetical protein